MRNVVQRRCEILLAELGWFAYGLYQRCEETKPEPKAVSRVLLDAICDLRDLRKSYEPARPKLRRL